MNHVGKNIKTLRKQKRWTQKEVAEKLGVSVPAFSKMETGMTDLNLSRLNQIAGLFIITPAELLSEGMIDKSATNLRTLNHLKTLLSSKEAEIIRLQNKIIQLYETVRASRGDN